MNLFLPCDDSSECSHATKAKHGECVPGIGSYSSNYFITGTESLTSHVPLDLFNPKNIPKSSFIEFELS